MEWFFKKKIITPFTAVFLCISTLAVSLCICFTLPQSSLNALFQRDINKLYDMAVIDAMSAQKDEIMPLFALDAQSDMTTFNTSGQRVLLLSLHNSPDLFAEGKNINLSEGEVWCFTDKEIAKWYQSNKKGVKDWDLRLKQLAGLSPDSNISYVTAMWVRPQDCLRPAYNTDVTDTVMTLSFGENTVSQSYKRWFDENVLKSYYDGSCPWTRLGYTYDWAVGGDEYGLCEFIIEKDSDVVVEFTKTTKDFVSWLENYEAFVPKYANVKELQKNVYIITSPALQQTEESIAHNIYTYIDTAFKRHSNKVKLNKLYADSDAALAEAIDNAITNRADVVFSFNGLTDTTSGIMAQKAYENPKTSFVVFEDPATAPTENLSTVNSAIWEGAFLAGFAAAKSSKSGIIGFIGVADTYENSYYEYGFKKGAAFVNNNCVVLSAYIDSYADTAAAKEAATQLYISGADIVFEATGEAAAGVFEAAEKYKKYVICGDLDKTALAPKRVLLSVAKNYEVACNLALVDLAENNSCGAKAYTLSLANGGIDISDSSDNINQRIYDEVLLIKEKIIAGEINVAK